MLRSPPPRVHESNLCIQYPSVCDETNPASSSNPGSIQNYITIRIHINSTLDTEYVFDFSGTEQTGILVHQLYKNIERVDTVILGYLVKFTLRLMAAFMPA